MSFICKLFIVFLFSFFSNAICFAQGSIDFTVVNPTIDLCEDGSISVDVDGGISPYEFVWTFDDGSGHEAFSNDQNIFQLRPYEYCVTITDAFCSFATECFQLECCPEIPPETISHYCSSQSLGSISLDLGDTGYRVSWTGPNGFYDIDVNTIINLEPGIYTARFSGENNDCISTKDYVVLDNSISYTITSFTNPSCAGYDNDGFIEITTTLPSTIEWYNALNGSKYGSPIATGNSISELGPNEYVAVITTDECNEEVPFRLHCCFESNGPDRPRPLFPPIVLTNMIINPSIDGFCSGSFSYSTNQPPYAMLVRTVVKMPENTIVESLDNLCPGEYCITINNGCEEYTECITVENVPCSDIELSFDIYNPCPDASDGSVEVSVGDGVNIVSILWSSDEVGFPNGQTSALLQNVSEGTYCVEVETDVCGIIESCIEVIHTTDDNDLDVQYGSYTVNIEVETVDGTITVPNLICVNKYSCRGIIYDTEEIVSESIIGNKPEACNRYQVCPDGTLVQGPWISLPMNESTRGITWDLNIILNGSGLASCEFYSACPYDGLGLKLTQTFPPMCLGSRPLDDGFYCEYSFRCRKVVGWHVWPFWPKIVQSDFTIVDECGLYCDSDKLIGNDPTELFKMEGGGKYIVIGKEVPSNTMFVKTYNQQLELESSELLRGVTTLGFLPGVNQTNYWYGSVVNDQFSWLVDDYYTAGNGKDGFVIKQISGVPSLMYIGGKGDQEVIDVVESAGDVFISGNYSNEFKFNGEYDDIIGFSEENRFFVKGLLEKSHWAIQSSVGAAVEGMFKSKNGLVLWGNFEKNLSLNGKDYLVSSSNENRGFVIGLDFNGEVSWVSEITSPTINVNKYKDDIVVAVSKFVLSPDKQKLSEVSILRIDQSSGEEKSNESFVTSINPLKDFRIETSENRILLFGTVNGAFKLHDNKYNTALNSEDIFVIDLESEQSTLLGGNNDEHLKFMRIEEDRILYLASFLGETTLEGTIDENIEALNFVLGEFSSKMDKSSSVDLRSKKTTEVNIYPNPFNNTIYVSITKSSTEEVIRKIEILSLEGKVVKGYTTANNHDSVIALDVNGLNQGIYCVKVFTNEGSYVKMIVKN